MMKVICPYTALHPRVASALDHSGWPWKAIDVSHSDTTYARLFGVLWATGETFALVEHDIVIRPGVLDELAACDEQWCAFSYSYQSSEHYGLGCVKFSADLLCTYPDAVAETWLEVSNVHPRGHWCNLDDRLSRVLTARCVTQHQHGPPVEHLHTAPSHGCT